MRLGQLARKLAIPPSQISDFLTSQGMPSIEGSNTRLTDDQLSTVLQRFAPADLASEILTNDTPEIEEVIESTPIASEVVIPESVEDQKIQPELIQESELEAVSEMSDNADQVNDGKIETIKAQKVALSGLKVLGKIELPEPKKKSAEAIPEATTEGLESKPEENNRPPYEKKRPQQFKKERREQRPSKNPIAMAREREAQAAEEKRREEEKRRKEQRTLNYQKRIKTSAPTKAARLVDEDVVRMSDVDMKPEPKTLLGKFWRWFTT